MLRSIFALTLVSGAFLGAADTQGLGRLMQGNERFVRDALEHPNRTGDRREAVISKQEPFAVIVGCSDSRVPPEIVFDEGVGDLFVVRVAGNVVGPLELDSIEYGIVHLHAKVVLVLGHENCGAVHAVLEGVTQDIEAVAELIQPAIAEVRKNSADPTLEKAIKANARRMRDYLLSTAVIKKYVADKKIEVAAAYYNLQTGSVELLK